MATIAFDTLKYAKRLEAAGIATVEAEAIAEAQNEALSEMMKLNELASKTDLVELKFDLLKWIVGLALAQMSLIIGLIMKLT